MRGEDPGLSLAEARRSVFALRPSALDAQGLGGAIAAIAEQLSAGRPETITVTGRLPPLPQAMENHLVRVAQEAMANALRHAQARAVTVTLEADDRRVRITVRDDGRGFDAQQPARGTSHGMRGMRERAAELGGTLKVRSDTNQGTEVTIEVPRP
jgi:signal transduction histidine kinase